MNDAFWTAFRDELQKIAAPVKKGRINPRSVYSTPENPIRKVTLNEPGDWMPGWKEEKAKRIREKQLNWRSS